GATQQFSFDPDPARPGTFSRAIDNVQESFHYQIALGDDSSERFDVQAILRPAVAQVQCQQIYPPYTKLAPARRLPGDLSLLKGTIGMSIHLIDEHGLESKNPAVYRIDLLPDKPPTVRITSPERKEELVTPMATVTIGFDAADDFAIGKIAIKYRLTRGGDA